MTKLGYNLVTVQCGWEHAKSTFEEYDNHPDEKAEEKGLPTTGTKAHLEMHLEQVIREIGRIPDEFFITIKEMPTAKEMKVSNMFNKLTE